MLVTRPQTAAPVTRAWQGSTRTRLEMKDARHALPTRHHHPEAQRARAMLDTLRLRSRLAPLAKKANTRRRLDLGRAKRARKANSRELLGLALVRLVHLVPAPPPAA